MNKSTVLLLPKKSIWRARPKVVIANTVKHTPGEHHLPKPLVLHVVQKLCPAVPSPAGHSLARAALSPASPSAAFSEVLPKTHALIFAS